MLEMENSKDRGIIQKLLDILNISYKSHKYFNDGVSSRVILLNDKYLIKQNNKLALKAEVEFLKLNDLDILQKIVYVDPEYEFVVYEFIHGETMKLVNDPKNTIKLLRDICSKYKRYNKEGFGYLNEEVSSWKKFLYSEIEHASKNISKYITSKEEVRNAIEVLEQYPFEKKLLHGDFGTHNFIKEKGKMIGIIDPMPVIGDALYDFIFALASNTDLLISITIEEICNMTKEPEEKVRAMLKVVLYCRISRCLKHHPKDIDTYMKYWSMINI